MGDGSFINKFNINSFLFTRKVVSIYKDVAVKLLRVFQCSASTPHHIYIYILRGPPCIRVNVVSQDEQKLLGSPPTLGYDC